MLLPVMNTWQDSLYGKQKTCSKECISMCAQHWHM